MSLSAVVHLSGVARRERTALKTPALPCTGSRRDRAGECGKGPHHGVQKNERLKMAHDMPLEQNELKDVPETDFGKTLPGGM